MVAPTTELRVDVRIARKAILRNRRVIVLSSDGPDFALGAMFAAFVFDEGVGLREVEWGDVQFVGEGLTTLWEACVWTTLG